MVDITREAILRITTTLLTHKILTIAAQVICTGEEATTADTTVAEVEEVIPREITDLTLRGIHISCHLNSAECPLSNTETIISIGDHVLPLASNNSYSATALEPLLPLVNTVRDRTATIVRRA
jgi:hypothetical protein